MSWGDRRAELVDLLEHGLVDRCSLAAIPDRDLREIIDGMRRAPPPPENLRAKQYALIADYRRQFHAEPGSVLAAAKAIETELRRYERGEWKRHRREPGPPESIRGDRRGLIWEILALGPIPAPSTIWNICNKSSS